ncbi:MAG: hypothetical protein KAY24_13690 [Candidatus Eisenbacteria sp.]|nr:hypothetical protein [Candidatus Eisenbacteria bacterium]
MTIATSISQGKPYDPSWGENPLLQVRKTVLSFLQGLFEQAPAGCFQWHESLEATEIVITDESPIALDVVGKRPAISLVRAPAAFGQTSLDEMRSNNFVTGQRRHTDLLSSTMSVNCCSRVSLESEYIAWIAAQHIWLLRRLMIKGTAIHDIGRGCQIGSPSPAGAIVAGDTEGEWICTSVSVPFFLQVAGEVSPLASSNQTMVKAIEARIGVRGSAQVGPTEVRGQATAAPILQPGQRVNTRPPTIRGKPIRQIAFEQRLTTPEE